VRAILLATTVAAVALGSSAVAGALTSDTYTYKATLTTRAEVPKPKAPAGARGTFSATVVENGASASIRWKITYRGLSGKSVGAHVHRGRPGVAGPVLIVLCKVCASGKTGKATITNAVSELLERGAAYVNVHTAKNPAGEIRGQVKLVSKTDTGDTPDDGGGTGGGDDGGSGGGGGGGGGDDNPPPGY
jgi:uncharacterized membrane protein YgcG